MMYMMQCKIASDIAGKNAHRILVDEISAQPTLGQVSDYIVALFIEKCNTSK